MAGVMNATKLSARLAWRYGSQHSVRRGFTSSASDRAAQNFIMPALSPTMTEGNIASWRVKEGDSFSAGDVLLEIETDKATMDVEAQDDGIMVKVTQQDGSKGVKVGQRIAVTAEPGDDISSLEIPAEESASSEKSPKKEEPAAPKSEQKSSSPASDQESSSSTSPKKETPKSTASSSQKPGKQRYPLYPSVEHMLHRNGLSEKDAESITATGPGGRLLKGDVLAHLGKIGKDYAAEASARIDHLAHLDLSNIQIAAPAKKPEQAARGPAEIELPEEMEVAVPISLSAVIATQKRVQDSLGIFLPLSTFVARASELANEALPVDKSKPTADDLFNSVLGLDQVHRASRGHFVPEISGITPMPPRPATRPSKKQDIIDILAASAGKKSAPEITPADLGISAGDNVFSVTAKPGEEERATLYLERMKMALEKEPGRLIL